MGIRLRRRRPGPAEPESPPPPSGLEGAPPPRGAQRGRGSAPGTGSEAAPAPSSPCTRGWCSEPGLPCSYVDRRGRGCGTAWCPEHGRAVAGRVYCPRHAGVVAGVAGGYANPDLETRAAALVDWLGRRVDGRVRAMLAPFGAAPGTTMVVDGPTLAFEGHRRDRSWERSWKLPTAWHGMLRVALRVREEADSEVAVLVGGRVVARLIPPWIQTRDDGASEDVQPLRVAFDELVLHAVESGLRLERELNPTA